MDFPVLLTVLEIEVAADSVSFLHGSTLDVACDHHVEGRVRGSQGVFDSNHIASDSGRLLLLVVVFVL